MNPPPSYQEILQLLNKLKLGEMKLTDEIKELKKELETTKVDLKIKTDELTLFHTAYTVSKKNEYYLEKFISKL